MSLRKEILLFNPFLNFAAINREHEIFSIVFAIGGSIKKDISLSRALVEASNATMSNRYKVKLLGASSSLDEGAGIAEVISSAELAFLPKEVRVILASNLSNNSKGNLLCEWRKTKLDYYELGRGLYPCVPTLAIGGLTFISLIWFVIPQFQEIGMGLNVNFGPLMKIMGFLSANFYVSSLFSLIFMLVIILLIIAIFKKAFDTEKLIDYSNLYKCLSIIDINEFDTFLGLMSNKMLFPKNHAEFAKFASAIRSGANFEEAGELSGIDGFYVWFIKLGLNSNDPKSMFSIASKTMNSKIDAVTGALAAIIPPMVTAFVGLGIGLVAIAVFQMMIKLMVASIG